LLNWGNFAQIERNSPEIFGAKLNCAGSPISGEKNNYCEELSALFYLLFFLQTLVKIQEKILKLPDSKENTLVMKFKLTKLQESFVTDFKIFRFQIPFPFPVKENCS
jgi:hypothetical protein